MTRTPFGHPPLRLTRSQPSWPGPLTAAGGPSSIPPAPWPGHWQWPAARRCYSDACGPLAPRRAGAAARNGGGAPVTTGRPLQTGTPDFQVFSPGRGQLVGTGSESGRSDWNFKLSLVVAHSEFFSEFLCTNPEPQAGSG